MIIDDFCKVDIEQYIKNCFEKQKSIFLKTEIAIKAAQDKQKQQYAQRKGIAEYGFKIGDKVLRRNMQRKGKKWKIIGLVLTSLLKSQKPCASLRTNQTKFLNKELPSVN